MIVDNSSVSRTMVMREVIVGAVRMALIAVIVIALGDGTHEQVADETDD